MTKDKEKAFGYDCNSYEFNENAEMMRDYLRGKKRNNNTKRRRTYNMDMYEKITEIENGIQRYYGCYACKHRVEDRRLSDAGLYFCSATHAGMREFCDNEIGVSCGEYEFNQDVVFMKKIIARLYR